MAKEKRSFLSGFTLIELLVVISILSVLAAMVLVALQRTRGQSSVAKYAQELQSLRTAVLVYRSNHNNQLPPCPSPLSQGSPSPLQCFDYGGFPWFDEALKPLVDDKVIPKIPHLAGWPDQASIVPNKPWLYAQYLPNVYNYANVLAVEYSCDDKTYANWKPGSSPGVIFIISTIPMPLPVGYTACDTAANTCFRNETANYTPPATFYCLSLDF